MEKINCQQAAKEMGMSIGFVYGGLEQGKFPFGTAVKLKRWTYYINPEKFREYMGNKEAEQNQ